jgi:hypothetical protein
MRRLNLLLLAPFLLFASLGFGQQTSVNVNAKGALPSDTRPFGKYLAEICTLSGENRMLTCSRTTVPPVRQTRDVPNPAPMAAVLPQRLDQTISLTLACDFEQKLTCNPPIVAGTDFFIFGSSTSGQVVQQKVTSGNATPFNGASPVHYRANAPGLIIIRATANGSNQFSGAPPVDIFIPVIAATDKPTPNCSVLPPSPPTQTSPLDAPTIVSLLGNPTPFVLSPQGPNTIAIYATRQPLHDEETQILESFQSEIAALAGRSFTSLGFAPASKPFAVELTIPHAAALGDLTTRINTLNFSGFTIQDVGTNKIRVTSPAPPDCDTWTNFLSDIRQMEWQLISEPMSYKLFYLTATDVAAAFTGLASPAAPSATPATPTPAASSTPSPAPTGANITVTQPPGSNIQLSSDTTACVTAGLASGNTTACGAGAAAASASPSTATPPSATPTPRSPLGMQSVGAATIPPQAPPDLLVYSDTNPGDDAQIQERNRILALLDLPRPEMIINAWVMQNSSASPKAMGAFSNMVKDLVSDYDRQFEHVVLSGWQKVKQLSATEVYFNQPFRSYISYRFVADTFQDNKPDASAQALSQAFLDRSQAKLADPVAPYKRSVFEICERGHYCLGYNDLFNPLKPALTDLLLTIIAAQTPVSVVDSTVAFVEGRSQLTSQFDYDATRFQSEKYCDWQDPQKADSKRHERCHKIWQTLGLPREFSIYEHLNCAEQDYEGILYSLFSNAPPNATENPNHDPLVHLQCFKEEAGRLLSGDGVGLIRAAIADFLFNYKMSQQYPHEFMPYELSHSADALNNALSPFIDAFNRDLRSYQLFVRADMQNRVDEINSANDDRCCVKRLFGIDKPSFFNDGLITVRTISGQSTSVSTTSQSFLNASTAPELNSILSSLATGNGPVTEANGVVTSGVTPGQNSLATAVLGANPVKRFAALAGALANYQSSFAQIGRGLTIQATPRSLNTASSAEIAITLNADESAGGPAYTGGSDPAINTSRVANHDTTTRVRVDSVKLFEVSSFSAIVERSRSRFPLLPPFIEIPYIGTFAGVPIAPAKEFHSSTAVLSAYVMPTAADIATGLRFAPDIVVDALNPGTCSFYKNAAGPYVKNICLFRKALSLHDLRGATELPISNFNKQLVRCFATDTSNEGCESVTFDHVPSNMD